MHTHGIDGTGETVGHQVFNSEQTLACTGEIKLTDPKRVALGIVRIDLVLDDLTVQTLRENLEGHAWIANLIESLGHAEIDHLAAVDVDIARAVLGKRGILDA